MSPLLEIFFEWNIRGRNEIVFVDGNGLNDIF